MIYREARKCYYYIIVTFIYIIVYTYINYQHMENHKYGLEYQILSKNLNVRSIV